MTWLRTMRPLLVAAGGVVLVGSLLGSRLLTQGGGGGTAATGKAGQPKDAAKEPVGTVVLGTADSDPSPVSYGLPPVLQSGQVDEVFVKQGDEVKAGAKLYRFNARILESKLAEAERAVETARAKLVEAQGAADIYATTLALGEQKVTAAEANVELTRQAREVGVWNKKDALKSQGIEPARWEEILKNTPELFDLYVKHRKAEIERDLAKAERDAARAAKEKKLAPLVAVAEAEVKRYEAMTDEARSAVEMCTVKAEQAGTIERMLVSKGDTLGIGSRSPAVILVPAGPRVVRAEVEAEFAHKIGTNQIGRKVTVHDFTDPKVSFQGQVRGIGNSFLPKRGNENALVQSETRVLEVVIDVLDPAPPGRPPLRVGQRVRVIFAP